MSGSRASASAKLVQRHQKRERSRSARALSEQFTQKQSHFARRLEEDHIRQMQSFQSAGPAPGGGGNPDLLTRRNAAAWAAADGPTDALAAPGPFRIAAPPPAAAISTTSAATFGLRRAPSFAGGGGGEEKEGPAARPHATRSTRRTARFNLGEPLHEEAGASALGSGLLAPVRRANDRESAGFDGILDGNARAGEEGAPPPRKLTRAERFREVVANSKKTRAQYQRERADRDVETKALDQEINALMHLLPRRNKEKEERQAFERSGTAEVQALLKSFKKNHVAKQVVIKPSGDFVIKPLVGNRQGEKNEDNNNKPIKEAPTQTNSSNSAQDPFLDEKDQALLRKIRAGASNSAGEVAETVSSAVDTTRKGEKEVETGNEKTKGGNGNDDDFDRMMNLMRLDERRAHATERTLTEEEQVALEDRQALLEMDRQAIPSLGLLKDEQKQLTRGEWIEQGGDRVFHMDHEDGEADDLDGNAFDITSSYGEADSQAGSEEMESDEKEDEDNDASKTTGKKGEKSAGGLLGSRVLDQILSEIEALAVVQTAEKEPKEVEGAMQTESNATKDSISSSLPLHVYSQLLSRLHHHARRHVLEVANAFRAILIEAERAFLRGRRLSLSRPLLLCLLTITKLFPMSDYRHEVVTPFFIFLSSTLMQMKLESLEGVHSYVGLNAILIEGLRGGKGKFASEAVVAAFNVLAQQLPRRVLEPAKHQGIRLPVPLVERCEEALLADFSAKSPSTHTTDEGNGENSDLSNRWRLLEAQHSAANLLLCAYHQLSVLADLYRGMAAFPAIFCTPFNALDAILRRHHPAFKPDSSSSPTESGSDALKWAAIRRAHEEVSLKIRDYSATCEKHRTPLALRTFRVRPIRQFEPLLAEREENAVKSEIREMKHEIREDKKRVIRHLAAEATVERRAREKEQAIVEAQRERRYNQVMGQLQAQQHIMKTVDAIMAKGKSRPKKGISGAPKPPSGGEGDEV